jgi:sugar phosphate isomerase/epimerase
MLSAGQAERIADASLADASLACEKVMVIACGALAREILAIVETNGLAHVELQCLPAQLHNEPDRIPDAVRQAIRKARPFYSRILVGYGDCGTGGLLDKVLAEEGVERIEGAHCYAFFAGLDTFDEEAEAEPGTFYLTDFLARHFETLVIRPLGLDTWPELRDAYFGNYTRLLYLEQAPDADIEARARAAAGRLGLAYQKRTTGYGLLGTRLAALAP